ncbi:MAG TPA: immunoglobulin domain-containing protein [Verrucomicrobiae bacterium]|jgi:hypothetical protein|nr:immunoglobulin domain-containing protein [Verrucomicrobiae bacterium]
MKTLLITAACIAAITASALPTYEPFTEYNSLVAANPTNSIDLCTSGLIAPSGEPWLNQSFSGTIGTDIQGLDVQVTNWASSVFTYDNLQSILPSSFPGLPSSGNSITTLVVNPAQPLVAGAPSPNIVGNSAALQFAQDITRPTTGTKTLFVSYLFAVAQQGQTGAGNIGRYLDFLASSNVVEGKGSSGFYQTWQSMYNTYAVNTGPRYFGHGVFAPSTFDLEPQDSSAGKTALANYTATPVSFNTPCFVVGEFVFVSAAASATGTKDTNIIWVNPSTTAFGGQTPTTLTENVDPMLITMSDVGGMVLSDRPGSGQLGGVGTNYIANLMLGGTWSYVTGGPEFTNQPANVLTNSGSTVTFSASATAAGQSVTYQWQRISNGATNDVVDGADGTGGSATVIGSATSSLTLAGVGAGDVGSYQLVATASGTGFALASSPVALLADPAIVTQPQSVQVNYGSNATFTVSVVTSEPSVSYFWYNGTTLLTNGLQADGSVLTGAQGTNGTGASAITLTLSNVSYLDDGGYTVLVSNNVNNSTTSLPGTLTVIDPYIVTEPPSSVVAPVGGNQSISVVAAGSGLTYQWYGSDQGQLQNGANFSGVTNSTLTILNAQDVNADSYYVVVNGASGLSVQSSPATLLIGNTNAGPFSPENWPGSIVYSQGIEVDYCIFDPNANFVSPGNWNNSLSMAANSGDQTYEGITLGGLFGDEVNNENGFLNVADSNFAYWEDVPVIDILMQVYGDANVYNNNPITALEGEISPANTLAAFNIGVPLGQNNGQWNWVLLEVTNPVDAHGFRTVGDNSVTSGRGENSGVNDGTIRFQSCNGWAVRAIAFGPQGAFGTSNQVNVFPAPLPCPPEPSNNLAYVDFDLRQTNNLTVISNASLGETYIVQSGVGPPGDLRTAIQSTSGLMNFGILSNYLGQPCNTPLDMELGVEFYDDPVLAGNSFAPSQYATDSEGDLTAYTGPSYTMTGTGQWLKVGFTIPTVDLEGVNTSPLTGGPTLAFNGTAPFIDRVELGVYQTGTNAMAGQTPDSSYQIDPFICATNYGYYAEWNPSAGIIENLDTGGYPTTNAGPPSDQRIAALAQFESAGVYYMQFGLLNSVFGPEQQGNLDLAMTLTYYDDPALIGDTMVLSIYSTSINGVNDLILPTAPYSDALVLQGTGQWRNATFELPNASLYGIYGSITGDATFRWQASGPVCVSEAQINAIRPCGPFVGVDYLQTPSLTTSSNQQITISWRGQASVQSAPTIQGIWSNVLTTANILTNVYNVNAPAMTNTADFFRLEIPGYPAYLGAPYNEGLIQNGDFLANASLFTQWPGYVGYGTPPNPSGITDWTVNTGNTGINGAGVNIATGSPFGPTDASQYTYVFMQGTGALTQNLSLAANTTYQLTFEAAARSTDSGVTFQVQVGDSSQVYTNTGSLNGNSAAFTSYSFTFTTPSSISGTPSIQLQNVSATEGITVDFADVGLTEVSP